MNSWMQRMRTGVFIRIVMVAIAGLLLTACGGGDDEPEPTATSAPSSAQPTVEASAEATAPVLIATAEETAPVNTDMSSPDAAGETLGTPATTSAVASPQPATGEASMEPAGGIVATPDQAVPEFTGTPVGSLTASPASGEETPVTNSGQEQTGSGSESPVGDGTTGATLSQVESSTATPAATSAIVTPEATPAHGATPMASPATASGTPVTAGEPPVVTSCDVTDVPPFTADVTTYVLEVDLNFRTGPGSDCDLIGDGPLGEFSAVEVIGGPVIREGDDSPEWLQVRVGEQTGWLAAEFLAPAE